MQLRNAAGSWFVPIVLGSMQTSAVHSLMLMFPIFSFLSDLMTIFIAFSYTLSSVLSYLVFLIPYVHYLFSLSAPSYVVYFISFPNNICHC